MAAAIGAALVGIVAAAVCALVTFRLEEASQDQRLTDAAVLMQRELDGVDVEAAAHVEAEALEIAPVGLRIALFANGARVAGAQDIPVPAVEGCASRTDAAGRWRTCAVGGAARRVAVSTHRNDDNGRLGMLLLAVGAATLVAAFASALFSRALARWALEPLMALGRRIEGISDTPSSDVDLGPPSNTVEVEALRDTIRALIARLGTAVERSRSFSASAAHELRTPLATMMAELELASEQSPDVAASLARVRRTAGRLSVLVERLLTIARGDAPHFTEAVAMEDVVREMVAARSDADRARVEPSFEASGMVRGDEALLGIVVENLVDNALKFAPSGKVHVTVAEQDDEVCLTVRDEGPGVDPRDAERLLAAFTRGTHANEASVPGHGLGLSIVAHAVRLHGGDVKLGTRDDGATGAELRVTLPAWKPSAPSPSSS